MAVHLPNVYAISIDDVSGSAIGAAVARTSEQCQFAGWTHFAPIYFPSKDLSGLANVQRLMWHKAWKEARHASHILFFQYDGWVLDGAAWQDEWLQYDYIGAPWPWKPADQNVGNGGFSLRSVALMKYLAEHPDEFPVPTNSPEDAVLCQYYRPALEMCGFSWAPLHVAEKFSVERGPWRTGTFGFHGIYNIPRVLPPDEFLSWRAAANDYIRSKPEWKEL